MDGSESLFGSPPPSPTRGRSPSPALALPGATANIDWNSSTQNVGTIALTGSQNVSELPVNPLALSLSDAPRPPAQPLEARGNASVAPISSRPPPVKITPRRPKHSEPIEGPSSPPVRVISRRPTPPPIYLPGPSEPLPPNLLRSQINLLGTAGVVAGLRPSQLVVKPVDPPGTTSTNPIVIQDPPPTPQTPRRQLRPRVQPSDADVIHLSPPSTRDIIKALVEQDEVYDVLNDIMKFVATRPTFTSATPRQRSTTPTDERGKKRRKLRHVPAGAHLWDVPFPFNEGEGPESYQADWAKQRGKKLISDLLSLIKSATKRAALKNRVVKRQLPTLAELAAINKHYNIDRVPSPINSEVLADASNSTRPPIPHPPPVDPLDKLLSSLLSAPLSEPLMLDSGASTPNPNDPLLDFDPGLFNSWMDIFQTFPAPAEGFFPNQDVAMQPAAGQSVISTPSLDLDFAPLPVNNTLVDDSLIDPVLLALSTSNVASLDSASLDCPSLVGSPIPSSSSFMSEVFTPALSEGGFGEFGIVPGETSSIPAPHVDKGKQREVVDHLSAWTETEKDALSFLEATSMASMSGQALALMNQPGGQGEGYGSEGMLGQKDVEFSMLPTQPILGNAVKANVLARAKARRQQLVEEITRTRIALWETTIEGGVLATLVNKLST
ncbi:hypothetical protein MIND_00240300 [Mycena indigotica]|uniref:Uncharacterized protein n=1 Tax=Mycena indigotica TaxID=2126181 RepID=A0A8H6WEW5_9AGAR|nr:uncharacterized protein MIND_00240300 [Mycena indigotica]KAF7312273.1 hypothetical protein MIND_00240300 [Mycena indigotica]